MVVDSVRNAQKSLSISEFEQGQRMIAKSMDIKEEVNQSNLIRESKDVQSDERRQLLVEEVKAKQTEVSNIEKGSYDDLYVKSLKNKLSS